jgi:UDP-N-acetylglucosamine 2-epimerase
VEFDRQAIVVAIRFALNDPVYRKKLADCRNPFGDGRAAERTVDVLKRLRLGRALITKWSAADVQFLAAADGL